MFVLNEDLSIYATRGDIVFFSVTAEDDGVPYKFQAGDVLRLKVFGKKDAENVVLQKDFPVTEETEKVEIFLSEEDTKIGEVISKPKDYWYEVELNPGDNPQTIIGYDDNGPKVLKLFPEGDDIPEFVPDPDDFRTMDDELDMTSTRPVQNQAIARAVVSLRADFEKTKEDITNKSNDTAAVAAAAESAVAVERSRIDNLVAHSATTVSKNLEYLESITETTKAKIDGHISSDGVFGTIKVNLREANLVYGGTTFDIFVIPKECRPIELGVIHSEDGMEYVIGYDNANNRYYMSLRATATVAPSGAGTVTFNYALGEHELIDIRVGADGKSYASAGAAVRSQFDFVKAESNALKTTKEFSLMFGSMTNGVVEPTAVRVCFNANVKASRTVVNMVANSEYMYGYAVYDENGNYDGVDHGWNTMDGKPISIDSGYFRMNFRKPANGEMSEADMATIKSYVEISQFNVLDDIENVKEQISDGVYKVMPFALELGSFTAGEKVPFTTRARFVDKVKVNERTVATILPDSRFLYGYCFYDENGVYDGVDHGWITSFNQETVTFEGKGYVMFNFRRVDNLDITDDDMALYAKSLTIGTRLTVLDLDSDIQKLEEKVGAQSSDAVSSILVEHGRYKGASYVFARIPKTTNSGKTMSPKLHLTSVDGSIDGSKVSALNFAKREGSIFTMNAGLFNINTLQPVGQTIIDGVSYVNEPMTDDMGNPISAVECYPLCIDADGNMSAPYPRSVDTADMIADGVKYAVTGWGKIIDNFKACADTVENEIVHAETYIRQVIGQFQNGDYFVCTVDKSRAHVQNEAGLTYKDLAQLLMDKGVKFAYSLDGGGSAETVIGVRQLNPIYEGTVGRSVPTVITFE